MKFDYGLGYATRLIFGYLLEACIEILQFFLIFKKFHELSSQHVLKNLNSKNYHSTLGSFGTNYIFFNPNIFEILLLMKTFFFFVCEGKCKIF